MTEDDVSAENKTTGDSESLKIPAFLDCAINANAKTVVYDNLNLKNVTGKLIINNQKATLKDMTSGIFDGALSISGDVSTKENTPTFNLNLGANGFDISESFKDLDLLKTLAPVAKLLQGKLNTNINLSGALDKDFTPDINTISGNALAELLTTKINSDQGELFNKLEGALSFIDFDKLDLKDLKTKFAFANGNVSVKPFSLTYKDIAMSLSGSHGFDKSLKYSAIFNVPAKYLGSEINQLLSRINSEDTKNITIPVTANIGGSYTNPTVKTDLTSGISNLTKQLIEIEKQKLLNKGKDKVKDLLEDVIDSNNKHADSAKQKQNDAIKDVLGDVLGDNKPDSTKTTTEDAVKTVLGGLFGNKKKQKDTIQ